MATKGGHQSAGVIKGKTLIVRVRARVLCVCECKRNPQSTEAMRHTLYQFFSDDETPQHKELSSMNYLPRVSMSSQSYQCDRISSVLVDSLFLSREIVHTQWLGGLLAASLLTSSLPCCLANMSPDSFLHTFLTALCWHFTGNCRHSIQIYISPLS